MLVNSLRRCGDIGELRSLCSGLVLRDDILGLSSGQDKWVDLTVGEGKIYAVATPSHETGCLATLRWTLERASALTDRPTVTNNPMLQALRSLLR